MTSLRVSFVCQWFHPEPVSQPGWIVDTLRQEGAHIEVLTGIPNYPTGRVMSGYRAWRTVTEIVDGVRVRRTPLYPSHDASAVKRILNYASWAVSAAALGHRAMRESDVSLVYSSPATAAAPAMVARRLYGVPYVLLVQDVWPDSIFSSGFLRGRWGHVVARLAKLFVNSAYRHASHIVVISPGMVDLLASRGVPRDKLSLIYNWVDEAPAVGAAPDLRRDLGLSDEDFVVMYAGNHGPAQALESAVRAFSAIPAAENCHLLMVGDGVERQALEALAAEVCPDRVHFVDSQPRAVMPALMSQADVQLVSLADRPLFAATMPSKLQSVLAAGHPVLVSAGGDASTVVAVAAAGVTAPPEDHEALAAAVTKLRRASPDERGVMGRNGRAYYEQQMSEHVGARKLMSALFGASRNAPTVDVDTTSANLEGSSEQ